MSVKIYNIIKDNLPNFDCDFTFEDIQYFAKSYNLTEVEEIVSLYSMGCYAGTSLIEVCKPLSQICFSNRLFIEVSKGNVELDSDINIILNDVVSAVYKLEDLARERGYSSCSLPPKYAPGFMCRLFSNTNLLCSCFIDDGILVKTVLLDLYKILNEI